ncbi:MAG: hypothetical protein HDS10_08560 [Bacteroides sp.]|nr:hypothetical protein [Bacteroides sp.]
MAEDGQRGLLFKEIIIIINKPVKSLNNFTIKTDKTNVCFTSIFGSKGEK